MCLGGDSRTSTGHYGRADMSATLPDAGWLSVLVRPHHEEVCPLSRGVMSQPLSAPLQGGLRFLPDPLPAAPSARLAARFPPFDSRGRATGLPCFVSIPERVRSCLSAGGATSAAGER